MIKNQIQFEKEIQNKLDLLDEVFTRIKVPKILENSDFSLDKISNNFYLRFELVNSSENNIPIKLILSLDGVGLDIGGANEVFEWNNLQIIEKKNDIIQFFVELFTSYILLETCGEYKNISLFDKKGNFLNQYNISTSLFSLSYRFIRRNCQQKLFLPILN